MRLFVLAALLFLLMPAIGHAQSATPTPTAGIEQDDDDPGVVDDPSDAASDDDPADDDVVPDDGTDVNYCNGADGDYSYADGDYTYCYPSATNPQEDGGDGHKDKDDNGKEPNTVAGATVNGAGLGTSLPRTGGEPMILALMGLALICVGSGGRLMLGRR